AAPVTTATGAATPVPGGAPGLVWVNTDSHVYHKEGSRFYATTTKGKYVSEAEAIKEGDRAAADGGHELVWVNTETHVYHKEGSRFYGKTRKGKYVSEAEEIGG